MSTTQENPTASATGVPTLRNHVGGAWVAAAGDSLESRNPATGEALARVPLSTAADVDAAARAARAAFPGWRATPVAERARAVLALRETLVRHRDELAAIVTRDMGKTLADASGEVGRGIESVEAAAAAPHLHEGREPRGRGRAASTSSWSASRWGWPPRSPRSTSRR